MKMDIWHITGEGFHFGRHGLEREESGVHFPSDSLFAALVARMAALYGEEAVRAFGEGFLEKQDDPPVLISSAFPRAGQVLFFPRPLRRGDTGDLPADGPQPKDLKRVVYISEGVFRRLVGGESLPGLWDEAGKLQDGKVLYLEREAQVLPEALRAGKKRIWKKERRPHVTIGRAAQDSALYHVGRTVFNDGCGLFHKHLDSP